MSRLRRAALALGLVIVALLAAPAAARPDVPDPSHVILVMLRAAPDHFRPDQAYGGGYGDQLGAGARMRLARRIAARHGIVLINNWPMPLLGVDCFLMRIPENAHAEDIASEVARERGVAWSQPLNSFHGEGQAPVYDDPLFPAEPAAKLWHLAALHGITIGRNVTVALIDSKVDTGHPDLAGQIALARDFTGRTGDGPELHGTGVAGVIAARGHNHAGIVGVAPGARLLALRACWQEDPARTACDSFSLAKALIFAIERRSRVINMSLSGPPDPLIARLVAVGLARGSRIVAAVDPASAGGGIPAALPGVVAVTDRAGSSPRNRAYIAPGRDVPTTEPGGKWSIVNGSSFAAAHVSGLLALLDGGAAPGRTAVLLPSADKGLPIDACLSVVRAYRPHDCICAAGC